MNKPAASLKNRRLRAPRQRWWAGNTGRIAHPLPVGRRRDGRGLSRARQQAWPRRRHQALPSEFARDADRVARFNREAKLLASLNHPNIAAIHGLEESAGTQFLVLELVEGETLSERIVGAPGRAPEKIEEILKIALQIAEALEAAHEKGIIHRDLKPANVKVTPEGKVKVLDFGLAKAFAGEQAEVNLSNSPTISDIATQQGMILGTAADTVRYGRRMVGSCFIAMAMQQWQFESKQNQHSNLESRQFFFEEHILKPLAV
jgi:serine/threonine protein kinase